jgi:hypothetical protein
MESQPLCSDANRIDHASVGYRHHSAATLVYRRHILLCVINGAGDAM